MTRITKKTTKNSGQVLLAVVVAITIALVIGISVSTRNLSMSSRVSRTDTSSRLIAAVEGGIERFLYLDNCTLDAFSDKGKPSRYKDNCGAIDMDPVSNGGEGCILYFPGQGDDQIDTKAVITVEKYKYNSPDSAANHYKFTLDSGEMIEIPLYDDSGIYGGDSIELCWDKNQAAVYYIAYDSDGMISEGGLYPQMFNLPLESMQGFNQVNSTGKDGYLWCADIDLMELNPSKRYGLRIRSIYESATFGLYPTFGQLPDQGYKITAVSELVTQTEQSVSKKMTVYRSLPYLPDVLDYSIYTKSPF